MGQTTLEKDLCANCGVDVREGTQFCYNCGQRVNDEPADDQNVTSETNGAEHTISDETQAALDDLAMKLKVEDEADKNKLAAAAAERRRARVRPKKKKQIVWEPVDNGPGVLFVAITIAIVMISAAIVFLTVYWK